MSDGKIGFLIVTFAVLAISLPIIWLAWQPILESQRQNDPETTQKNTHNQGITTEHPPPKTVGVVEHLIDTLAGNVDRRPYPKDDLNDDDHRNEQDLVAQRIMARWTFGIFVFTGLTFVVVAVGTGLIYLTLRESRRLTGEAIKATSVSDKMATAAIQSNAIQRQSLIASHMPQITPPDFGICTSPLDWHGNNLIARLALEFTNAGVGPAVNIEVAWGVFSESKGSMEKFTGNLMSRCESAARNAGYVIRPGDKRKFPMTLAVLKDDLEFFFHSGPAEKRRLKTAITFVVCYCYKGIVDDLFKRDWALYFVGFNELGSIASLDMMPIEAEKITLMRVPTFSWINRSNNEQGS